MSLDFDSIKGLVRDWIFDVTGLPIRFSSVNLQRPTEPYVLYNMVSTRDMVQNPGKEITLVDPKVKIEYHALKEIFFSINIYYEDAYITAQTLRDSLNRVTVSEKFEAGDMSFIRATEVLRVPEEINESWEERAQFDVFFNAQATDSEEIEQITTVGVTNEISGDEIVVTKP